MEVKKIYGEKTNRECKKCGKVFSVFVSEDRGRAKENKHARSFCSVKCADEFKRKRNIVKCDFCGSDTEKMICRIENSKVHFCNSKCFRSYYAINPSHKANGTWLENGYEITYIGNNVGIKTHRKVMEEHIGRKLLPKELIHHIDGNKLNNKIENLKIVTPSEHSKLHRKKDIEEGKKLFCKTS